MVANHPLEKTQMTQFQRNIWLILEYKHAVNHNYLLLDLSWHDCLTSGC